MRWRAFPLTIQAPRQPDSPALGAQRMPAHSRPRSAPESAIGSPATAPGLLASRRKRVTQSSIVHEVRYRRLPASVPGGLSPRLLSGRTLRSTASALAIIGLHRLGVVQASYCM